jgi:hypothetical protein
VEQDYRIAGAAPAFLKIALMPMTDRAAADRVGFERWIERIHGTPRDPLDEHSVSRLTQG